MKYTLEEELKCLGHFHHSEFRTPHSPQPHRESESECMRAVDYLQTCRYYERKVWAVNGSFIVLCLSLLGTHLPQASTTSAANYSAL